MAALHPDLPIDRKARTTRRGAVAERPSIPLRAASGTLALVCAAAGLAIADAYPITHPLVLVLFAAWAVFAFVRFSFALPAMLALLPVLGFAPLTGWLTFEETDLLVLACGAGGYAAWAWRGNASAQTASRRDRPMLSIFALVLIAAFAASLTISLVRGFDAAGALRFDWFQGYDDALNSLRIYKSFAWAVLMTPLVIDEVRKPGGLDRIGLGMTIALGLGCLAVLQERLAFTGLLDFSDDYRVTGSFWEMHVGGAALDGFLALTIPFAVREAVRSGGIGADHREIRDLAGNGRFLAACGVLVLAGYCCLVTFSRGVYAAIPVSILLLVVLVSRQSLKGDRREVWGLLAKAVLFALLVAVSAFFTFRAGGYRAVLAVLGVLAVAIAAEPAIRRAGAGMWLAAVIAAALLGGLGHVVAGIVPKGPYLMYGLVFAAALAATWFATQQPTRQNTVVALAAWLCLAIDATLVARHWGGDNAFLDTTLVVVVWVVVSLALSFATRPVWPRSPHQQLATIAFAGLVMGAVAVFTAGAYMGGRFSTTGSDLQLRKSHWTEGIGRLRGIDTWLFGKGLGRFPATSQLESTDPETPGGYHLATRNGETFVGLTAPKMRYLGFGELFRFSQRVSVRPGTAYTVVLQARSAAAGNVHVELCERQLLYPSGCAAAEPKILAGTDRWQTVTFPLVTGTLGSSSWLAPRPVVLAIASGTPTVLEVRSLSLVGPDGDVIRNGSFTHGTAYWFSSSDKYHLPWHIKNILLDVLFDQGAVGLALFTLLVGGALLRSTIGRAYRHPDAPYAAAAIVGYLVVGLFDSLLDVPRVAFAFYVVTMLALMLRNPRATKDVPTASAPAPNVADEDAAAARRKRRQQAFGQRRPATN